MITTLVGGFIYSCILGDVIRFLPDEADYLQLASALATRQRYTLDGVNPSAYRAPGYPVVLAGFTILGAGVVHLRIVNYLFLVGNLLLVYKILSRQATRLGAILGIVMATAYPVLFFTAGTLYPQILASFLFLLALDIFTSRPLSAWTALGGGLLLGYLTLTVPIFLFTFLLIPAWLWTSGRLQKPVILLVLFIAACAPLSAWTIRNYVVFQAFVPLTLNTGENLLYGNSANTTPNAGTTVDISKFQQTAADLDEYNRNRYYLDQALDYIRRHPGRTAQLYILKFLNHFNYQNRLETSGEASSARDFLMLLTYGFLLGLALLRLLAIRTLALSKFELLLIALYLGSGLAYAVFFTRIRFRLPYDYLLILLGASFLEKRLVNLIEKPTQ